MRFVMRSRRRPGLASLVSSLLVPCVLAACGGDEHNSPETLVADLRADTNRDGVVDIVGTTDEAGKNAWTAARGAIMLPNIGDSAKRCGTSDDLTKTDAQLESCHDAADDIAHAPENFAPVRTMPIASATADTVGTLQVLGTSANKVRVFINRAGTWTYLKPADRLTTDELKAGAVVGIDARDVVRDSAAWDGRVTLRFIVRRGDVSIQDDVKLRVAPVLTYNHVQDAETVVVPTSGPGGLHRKFVEELGAAVKGSGLANPLLTMNTVDNWAQDIVEFGYVSMPKPNGASAVLRIALRSSQPGRRGGRAVFDLRGPGVGAVQLGGAGYHQVDSFGNLETVPPYEFKGKRYAAGRVIYGDAGDGISPHKDWRNFFAAQEDQAPIVLDTSWLAIGHVDEFVQFVPADTPRGWKIAIADPDLAIALLKKAQAEGHGSVLALARPNANMTIDQLLANSSFVEQNAVAAEAIRKNLVILKQETGVTDDEIIAIPGLYSGFEHHLKDAGEISRVPGDDPIVYGPGLLLSYHPAAINGIVVNKRNYISPKQFGPVIDGVDILAASVNAAYGKTGMTVRYVDDWLTHHASAGEVHCGTNTVRAIGPAWWAP